MIVYPSFFTKLEKTLMNKEMKKNIGFTEKHVTLGGHYANIVYTLFLFLFVTAVADVAVYYVHNNGQLNNDREMNKSLTSVQIALACAIIILSFLAFYFHITTNRESYVNKLMSSGAYNNNDKLSDLISGAEGSKIGPHWFAILILLLSFGYGMALLIFSADRLMCTMSTSDTCPMTKFTPEEKANLKF